MKSLLALLFLCIYSVVTAQHFNTPFEISKGMQSSTYADCIDLYKRLDKQYGSILMGEAGPTDTRYPLNVVYYDGDENFDIESWKKRNKIILLINNGIHPGEPDGIDASMMLLRDAATGKIKIPSNVILAVIPVFNIGGALNRGSYSRANQNGPEEYGFRGSAQNLDLNRDFIKMDAKETQSLVALFHRLDPDIFIDNHVSNGADYQHVMTLLNPQADKLGTVLGKYCSQQMEPALYKMMQEKGYDLVPYVNHWGNTPDQGWVQFYDPPRFASGFAGLFQTLPFVPETHMLKSFKKRVLATYALMQCFIDYSGKHAAEIQKARMEERTEIASKTSLAIDWMTDSSQSAKINFRGYEAKYKPSDISGQQRLYYDRDKPYTKKVVLYNHFKPSLTIEAPLAYIIPQGWNRVIDRLRCNEVEMQMLEHDTTMELTVYRITGFETTPNPYEGHYLHSKLRYAMSVEKIQLLKGDHWIPVSQKAKRYLIETLEPDGPDAFFAWGFFDAILQQKEHFSDYVFEEEAAQLLKTDYELKALLDAEKKKDKAFASDGKAQLDFIYRHSPYYEPVYKRYPVFRLE